MHCTLILLNSHIFIKIILKLIPHYLTLSHIQTLADASSAINCCHNVFLNSFQLLKFHFYRVVLNIWRNVFKDVCYRLVVCGKELTHTYLPVIKKIRNLFNHKTLDFLMNVSSWTSHQPVKGIVFNLNPNFIFPKTDYLKLYWTGFLET